MFQSLIRISMDNNQEEVNNLSDEIKQKYQYFLDNIDKIADDMIIVIKKIKEGSGKEQISRSSIYLLKSINFLRILGIINDNIVPGYDDKLTSVSMSEIFIQQMEEEQKNEPNKYVCLLKFISHFVYEKDIEMNNDNNKVFFKYLFMLCIKKLKEESENLSTNFDEFYYVNLTLSSEISDEDLENTKMSINKLINPEQGDNNNPHLVPPPKPDDKQNAKPDDKLNLTPDDKQNAKPDNKQNPKPDNKQNPKPDNKQNPKPDNKQNPKPDDKQNPKPDDKQNPKPDDKLNLTPDDKQNAKPDDKKPFSWETFIVVFVILGALLFYYLWKQKQNNSKEEKNMNDTISNPSMILF